MSPDVEEVTVLGAGIVGICTALALTERGIKVTLIDRDEPGQATSFGNAGIISPWSVVPQSMPGIWKKVPGWLLDPLGPVTVRPSYLPRLAPWGLRFLWQGREQKVRQISPAMDLLNRDCIALFRRHLAGTGHEDLIRDSYYVHAYRDPDAARLDTLDAELRQAIGADLQRISADDLLALEPALSPEFRAAILIKGQARALSPGRVGKVLAEKLQRMGGEIRRATVQAILPLEGGGWSVGTDQGEMTVPRLVLAMGVWSAELLRPLGIRIPLEAERGYHVCFTRPGITLNHSVMDADMKFVASTMEDGLRVAGTAEFAGLDAPVNEKRLKGLVELAKRLSPDLNSTDYTTWSGQRPSLPDSLPCIGEIEGFPGLIAAFGHSHYGLMMAPKTGELVADIATGRKANTDLSPFRVLRFG
ncbi:FAD-binding oxidoreductase [Ruegeria sp. WL0004]|uniref:FAD-binding oxidoreductase n=1 Tax=Ruegeria marisflavi TaxID=2984152 RepID=A0ABT2WTI6_9RHOB|nr:FAD-dependent oxidoreductase [Ruegeria sp. WL0004]MCU9837343.1 FAD-binding oxidoreductase [Ruegeria sp. WL0004]